MVLEPSRLCGIARGDCIKNEVILGVLVLVFAANSINVFPTCDVNSHTVSHSCLSGHCPSGRV